MMEKEDYIDNTKFMYESRFFHHHPLPHIAIASTEQTSSLYLYGTTFSITNTSSIEEEEEKEEEEEEKERFDCSRLCFDSH